MIEALLSKDPWFAPKRFGYGSGLPIAWQGWVLSGVFIAATAGCGMLIERGMIAAGFILLVPLTLAFLALVKRHTSGGWKWRSGGSDD